MQARVVSFSQARPESQFIAGFVREDCPSANTNSWYVSTFDTIPQAYADRHPAIICNLGLRHSGRPQNQLAPLWGSISSVVVRKEEVKRHDQALAKDSDVLEAAPWSRTVDGMIEPV
jgi:hypothetical protein